jgi:hypothetical protein
VKADNAMENFFKISFTRREILLLGLFIVVMLGITAVPFIYAYRNAPPEFQFMGVMVNIPDHFQYFSWMRESQMRFLVPNQLTPEPSTPLLFNFLWWTLGRIERLTGLSYDTLYQITRLLAGAFVIAATYFFCGLVFTRHKATTGNERITVGDQSIQADIWYDPKGIKRWTACLIGVLAGGFGWMWVVEKYVSDRADILYPFDIYTSEPNTFFNILAFPHFSIAAGLITVIFGLLLIGQRTQQLKWAWIAAFTTLLLGVQHSYDMFIIYPVIGLYALFIWIADREFPWYLFKFGLIVVLISMWPALQAFYITTADEVWRGVLAQFDNAGAWTPPPHHLPILMGFAWLLAIWGIDFRTPWRERDDIHLLVLAWFLAHFVVVYLPLNFQIHLLSGWQVVGGVLATVAIYKRVVPLLQRLPRLKTLSTNTLGLGAAALVLLMVLPTNVYLLAWRMQDMRAAWAEYDQRTPENRYFLRTTEVNALHFLETQAQSDDVVLASLDIGQFVPALTGARSFLGHWAQTLDFYGKRDAVAQFFDAATSDADRQRILQQYRVTYVFYSPEEAKLGTFDPAGAGYLESVYAEGDVQVYAVSPAVLAAAGG